MSDDEDYASHPMREVADTSSAERSRFWDIGLIKRFSGLAHGSSAKLKFASRSLGFNTYTASASADGEEVSWMKQAAKSIGLRASVRTIGDKSRKIAVAWKAQSTSSVVTRFSRVIFYLTLFLCLFLGGCVMRLEPQFMQPMTEYLVGIARVCGVSQAQQVQNFH